MAELPDDVVGAAARNGQNVQLLEKNEKLGKSCSLQKNVTI